MSSEPSTPTSPPSTTHEEATLIAQVLLDGGVTPADVVDKLVDRDVERTTAQAIVGDLQAALPDGPLPHMDRMVQPILYMTLVVGVVSMFFLVLFALNR